MISVLLMALSITSLFINKSMRGSYMNWTIDFKGGTEMIFAFIASHRKGLRPNAAGKLPAAAGWQPALPRL